MTKLSRRAFLSAMAVSSGFVTWALHSSPAQAYQVTLLPASPRLGDTLSVFITGVTAEDDRPFVSIGDSQYPSFPLSDGRFRAFVPTSPRDAPGEWTIQVTQAGVVRSHSIAISDRQFRTQYITLPPGQSDLGTDHEFDRVAEFKKIVTPERHWQGPLLRPSTGSVSTEFGVQRYYNGVFAEDYYHRGVDYAAPTGSPIVAPAAGHIRLVGLVRDGFELHGNTVGIDHGQGVLSIMIHMNRVDVQEGEFVAAGQTVGGVGSTGASTGPHLHWGLYVNGIAVDPVPWRFEGVE
ncbi:M23 family metallopeptidase [cf. Phormidesmis sp. LEGE 11477]|uniref:M23 family metallopeptidase n=1 Tax=cf. Phormidesmis sp. LEGE 11477 TaxID=1828680 RepID=UPI00187FE91A|nr:M23 family metallopeptidase [cf. Phormidesmis sp. LEGE 11477]MBE9064158.1 M23 family metallopeptidase [cf. Phormidesmis sp. LEGE 11477]